MIIIGALVLLAWIPLRQKPGIGTVSNVFVVGARGRRGAARCSPRPRPLGAQLTMLAAGVFLNGVAGAAYIGAGLGPGPRDGLMTGFVRRPAARSARVRTGIEVSVLAVGIVLGGTVGLGTVLYALSIGPLLQVLLPAFTIREPVPATA